ncbi:unnamed protein product [Rhizophagus irregularis]|nr:unnamed protein product [Rhizophagus irregularis]
MSDEELSQHTPALLKLLTDKLKRDKGRQRFQKGRVQSGEVNLCQMSDLIPEGKTLKRIAQRITQDNLSEKDVESIAKALVESASNDSAGSSRISRLRRELRTLNAPEKIISATLIPEITRSANKIQKESSEQRENEGIDFSDHFSLESVKERLNSYDISNILNIQALADVMIMLCIRPAEIKTLCISNGV